MNAKNILLILLVAIAAYMIYLGLSADMKPPTMTGIGFILISYLIYKKD